MKTNKRVQSLVVHTHEGGPAQRGTALMQFRRIISTCLLFENTFYESGVDIAANLEQAASKLPFDELITETIRAKDLGLRHVPLYAALLLTKQYDGKRVGDTITNVIRRADELAEIIALYWKDGKQPLSNQLKRGIANAFGKFNAYQFGKYKGAKNAVSLQDSIRLVHPKADDEERNLLYKQIASDTLPTPDTWEVALSAGADKKATWERLLSENKLGALALLRNLAGMEKAGVDRTLVLESLSKANTKGIFPFQFVTALRAAAFFARGIDDAMLRTAAGASKLSGTTVVLVDVSGSMDHPMSAKSAASYLDAAASVAVELNERCIDCRILTFSNSLVEVAGVRGIGLMQAIARSQMHGGTYLGVSLQTMMDKEIVQGNRLVVITDEQSADRVPKDIGFSRGYMVNVTPYRYGVSTGADKWVHINGFAAGLVDWIVQEEVNPLFGTDTD